MLVAAIAVAGLSAAAAQADPSPDGLVAAFTQLCGDTEGKGAQALEIADVHGWAHPPENLRVSSPPAPQVHWLSRQGRIERSAAGVRVLMVGTMEDPDGHVSHSCIVMGRRLQPGLTPDMRTMRAELTAWVGGEPVKANDDFIEFAYREGPDGRTPLPRGDDPLTDQSAPPGDVVVTLMSVGGMPMVSYMRR
jgi:hypothetical protein